jgi:queuine tRNA-ribosyltransferase
MSCFSFEIDATDGAARIGRITMGRGEVRTPAFMPVGTAATVKAMLPGQVRESGADILLANVYHLMLRPGAERIAELGGLHKFMNWPHPILTDSGGYQVYSLAKLRKISEEGVAFQSHIDGAEHMLSPERAIEVQRLLGADIAMVFDECTPFPASQDEAATSMELSLRWAGRSKAAFEESAEHAAKAALFGIIQGGTYANLRKRSAASLQEIGFDGLAVGGLAVGEGQEAMFGVLDAIIPELAADKPRYLMGVGKPDDLIGAVLRGVDMFDCVLPTRSGRTAQAFTRQGPLNLKNARHRDDPAPLDAECGCATCTDYSRAYLHHLVRAEELLAPILLTLHNLTFYQDLMAGLRAAINEGRLDDFAADFLATYGSGETS